MPSGDRDPVLVGTRFVLRCDGKCGAYIDVDVEARVVCSRLTRDELDDVFQPILRAAASRLGWKNDRCPGCQGADS